jgi:hypothetical protein
VLYFVVFISVVGAYAVFKLLSGLRLIEDIQNPFEFKNADTTCKIILKRD